MAEVGALPKMLVEVAVFAVILYIALRFLRETRGVGVVRGLSLLLVVGMIGFPLLISLLQLDHLGLLFNVVAQSVVIALVVVFHPEIRRAIVHLGDSPIFGRFFQKESKIVQRVLRAVARMSKERIGALIAVEREAALQSLAESGITIDAELNSFLIESIFYPKSALHDGAIIVRDDRIVAASCLLPLSQNSEVDKRLGTRHRAALGLSEETDALAIVVSEETGKVSTALGGKLQFDLTLEQLERQMDVSLGIRQRAARHDQRRRRSLWAALAADPVRKLLAVALGVGVYYLLDKQIHDDLDVPMQLHVLRGADDYPAGRLPANRLLISLPQERVELRNFVDLTTGAVTRLVTLNISGPKYLIDNLRNERLELPVTLPAVDWEKVEGNVFTVADIQRTIPTLNNPNVALTMDPPRVRVDASRVSVQEQPLRIDQVDLLVGDDRLRSRLRLDTAEFSHPSAKVVGPTAALQTLQTGIERPFEAELHARENDRHVTATLSLHKSYLEAGLRLQETVTLTVQLQPVMQEFTFDLPVQVDDLSLPADLQGRYQPDARVKVARVKAGGALLSQLIALEGEQATRWAANNLRLCVWIQPRDDNTPYPTEFTQAARLEVLGRLRDLVGAVDFGLAETVSITLRRAP